jgi:hypothetical protein
MNSKTRTNTVEDAPAADADVLAQFEQFHRVLRETHQTIPDALRQEQALAIELGRAEITGGDVRPLRERLDAVVGGRAIAIRRRSAAAAAIVELEGALRAEREVVEQQRQAHAVEAVCAFQTRYNAAVAVLQGLWNEGEAVAKTLRAPVPMPLPVKVPLPSGDASPTVDAEAARLGGRLDAVDAALGRIAGIKQSHDLDTRHFQMATIRRTPTQYFGSFLVVRECSSLTDGLAFAPGQLVDRSLLGDGTLARLVQHGLYLRLAHLETATTAA